MVFVFVLALESLFVVTFLIISMVLESDINVPEDIDNELCQRFVY